MCVHVVFDDVTEYANKNTARNCQISWNNVLKSDVNLDYLEVLQNKGENPLCNAIIVQAYNPGKVSKVWRQELTIDFLKPFQPLFQINEHFWIINGQFDSLSPKVITTVT